eukprot:2064404-Amphidinium_carterae.1
MGSLASLGDMRNGVAACSDCTHLGAALQSRNNFGFGINVRTRSLCDDTCSAKRSLASMIASAVVETTCHVEKEPGIYGSKRSLCDATHHEVIELGINHRSIVYVMKLSMERRSLASMIESAAFSEATCQVGMEFGINDCKCSPIDATMIARTVFVMQPAMLRRSLASMIASFVMELA